MLVGLNIPTNIKMSLFPAMHTPPPTPPPPPPPLSTPLDSDHNMVNLKLLLEHTPRGKGFWKLNCYFLEHDPNFQLFIKEKIYEFKQVHKECGLNPNIIRDALKCYLAGHCMEYCSRKKKESVKEKKKARGWDNWYTEWDFTSLKETHQ